MPRLRLPCSALAAVLGFLGSLYQHAHAQAPQYMVQGLGTLWGTASVAYGVNNNEVREYMAIGVIADEEVGQTSEIREVVFAG